MSFKTLYKHYLKICVRFDYELFAALEIIDYRTPAMVGGQSAIRRSESKQVPNVNLMFVLKQQMLYAYVCLYIRPPCVLSLADGVCIPYIELYEQKTNTQTHTSYNHAHHPRNRQPHINLS